MKPASFKLNNYRRCIHCGTPNWKRANCWKCGRFFDVRQKDLDILLHSHLVVE